MRSGETLSITVTLPNEHYIVPLARLGRCGGGGAGCHWHPASVLVAVLAAHHHGRDESNTFLVDSSADARLRREARRK